MKNLPSLSYFSFIFLHNTFHFSHACCITVSRCKHSVYHIVFLFFKIYLELYQVFFLVSIVYKNYVFYDFKFFHVCTIVTKLLSCVKHVWFYVLVGHWLYFFLIPLSLEHMEKYRSQTDGH